MGGNGMIVYTLSDCPVCITARRELTQQGVAFTERQVDDSDLWQEEVRRLTAQSTVPVFVHDDGRVEVGYKGEKG